MWNIEKCNGLLSKVTMAVMPLIVNSDLSKITYIHSVKVRATIKYPKIGIFGLGPRYPYFQLPISNDYFIRIF